jgi:hypothetical protein
MYSRKLNKGIIFHISEQCIISYYQSWAPALFSRFRPFALASAKLNKKRGSAKKKKRKKSESNERERKKVRIRAFFVLRGTFLCMYVCMCLRMYICRDVCI